MSHAAPPVVSRADWLRAHAELLIREKALTNARDELAAARRRMPRERVEADYSFVTPTGSATLAELFDGRRQLIVYHHMLRPADPAPCAGCSMVGDQIPHLAHLHARDTSLVFVSCAPIGEIAAFRERMGWAFPWVETGKRFNTDFDVGTGFGLNVFLYEHGAIYRTGFTSARGVETLGTPWALLDLTPYGRQECWESSPTGTPQGAPYGWWRLHDEYEGTSPVA